MVRPSGNFLERWMEHFRCYCHFNSLAFVKHTVLRVLSISWCCNWRYTNSTIYKSAQINEVCEGPGFVLLKLF